MNNHLLACKTCWSRYNHLCTKNQIIFREQVALNENKQKNKHDGETEYFL